MGRLVGKKTGFVGAEVGAGGRHVGAGLDGEEKLERGSERGALFYRQTVFWLFLLERTLDGGVKPSRCN